MNKQPVIIGICLTSCLLATKALGQNYNDMYVFGDSLVDNGNFYKATQTQTPDPIPPLPGPPYPGEPYYEGRFSNGPVFVEYLPGKFNFADNPDHNYAYGGATSGTEHAGGSAFPGLLTQIDNFTSSVSTANPNALYVISAGSNDYDEATLASSDPSEVYRQIEETVGNLVTAVNNLYDAGARNIMVVDLPDFGVIPGNVQTVPEEGLESLTALTNTHNSLLASSLNDLSTSLDDIDIIPLNINVLFYEMLDNPAKFGFTNVTEACLNPVTLEVCDNPDEYLFWDIVHPSAATHRYLADFAFETIQAQQVPETSSALGILGVGVFGILGYGLKSKRKNQIAYRDTDISVQ